MVFGKKDKPEKMSQQKAMEWQEACADDLMGNFATPSKASTLNRDYLSRHQYNPWTHH